MIEREFRYIWRDVPIEHIGNDIWKEARLPMLQQREREGRSYSREPSGVTHEAWEPWSDWTDVPTVEE